MPATVATAAAPLEALEAPFHIGAVTLRVVDLPALTRFYREAIGLDLLSESADGAELGIDGVALVRLLAGGTAPRSPAGLFHLAILLPSRSELARWLSHAARSGVRLEGASDHLVSEALYLSDPEGNGIEIYRDRRRAEWPRRNGEIAMATERLDLNALLAEADGEPFHGMASGTRMGHIHLRVGDVPKAEGFYHGALGFEVMTHYPGAAFMATGGYHHHVATNIWGSRGAGPRGEADRGLAGFELVAADDEAFAAMRARILAGGGAETQQGPSIADPWGNRLVLVRG